MYDKSFPLQNQVSGGTKSNMSLQQDVLDTIGPDGVERGELRAKVGNVSQADLDAAVNALLRAGKLRLVFGRYEVISSARPPSADEELAANLGPAKRVCQHCNVEKVLETEFSKSNLGMGYLKTCKTCVWTRAKAGKSQKGSPPTATREAIKVTAPILEAPPASTRAQSSAPLDPALENAKAKRQAALNRIQVLQVDLANEQSVVSRCDEFLKLHAEFAFAVGAD